MRRKNLEVSARNEGTRDKFQTKVVRFELNQILQHFLETIEIVKAQFSVADELLITKRVAEAENIWRAQIVFLASAFDFYMHELTKFGLCEIYNENWARTEKYNNMQINMKFIEIALKSGEEIDWFLEYINEYYSTITMVSFDSVKSQFSLLGIDLKSVSYRSFYISGGTEKTDDKLKRRLNELFGRRNLIAHQTDREHTDAQVRNINKEIVHNFVDDLVKIVSSIHDEVKNK